MAQAEQRSSIMSSYPNGASWANLAAIPPPGLGMMRAGVPVTAHALALDTPILTTSGWKTMGTVDVGDFVYAEDGSATEITNVSDIFNKPCYELAFADGAKITATDDHLWRVWDAAGGAPMRHRGEAWKTLSTSDLIEIGKRGVQSENGNRFRVRCAAIVGTPEIDLLIDPYIFGYWLGDGSSNQPRITVGHEDVQHVRDQIEFAGYRIVSENEKTSEWGSGFDIRFANDAKHMDGIESRLKRLGVLSNKRIDAFGEKHIPESYMLASPKQRESLLAGLLDSDGSITKQRLVVFNAKNERLASDVHQLVRSLGERAILSQGSDGMFAVKWTPTFDPFRLARKSARFINRDELSLHGRRADLMSITSIESVSIVPTRCIAVAHPSHVFLVGRLFTPTHNTMMQLDSVFTSLRVLSNAFIKMGHPRGYTEALTKDNEPYRQWIETQPLILTNTFGLPTRGYTPENGRIFQYDGLGAASLLIGAGAGAFWSFG